MFAASVFGPPFDTYRRGKTEVAKGDLAVRRFGGKKSRIEIASDQKATADCYGADFHCKNKTKPSPILPKSRDSLS